MVRSVDARVGTSYGVRPRRPGGRMHGPAMTRWGERSSHMATVTFDHVTKKYGDVVAVDDFNLEIADGEFMVFVGPSGCGKTTSLRMIAGLEDISEGEVKIADRVVNDVPPKDRDIAMVFQSYALYPHMSVYDNLAFGLKLRKVPKKEIDRRVKEAAETIQLTSLLQRKPKELSGGQRQRVALALAAGELLRLALEERCQLDGLGRFLDPPVDLLLRDLPELEAEGEVVVHAHVGIERIALEDHRDVAILGRHVVDHPVGDLDLP